MDWIRLLYIPRTASNLIIKVRVAERHYQTGNISTAESEDFVSHHQQNKLKSNRSSEFFSSDGVGGIMRGCLAVVGGLQCTSLLQPAFALSGARSTGRACFQRSTTPLTQRPLLHHFFYWLLDGRTAVHHSSCMALLLFLLSSDCMAWRDSKDTLGVETA